MRAAVRGYVCSGVYMPYGARLPLHVATHSLVAFGGIFALDLHRPHQWIRVLALLGFHANLPSSCGISKPRTENVQIRPQGMVCDHGCDNCIKV